MMFGIGPAELVMVLALSGGGLGLPLSVPPLPPDPAIRSAAPENCLFYMRLAGLAAPDPKSKNHTEQLLAEEEVRQFIADVGKQIDSLLQQLGQRDPKIAHAREVALPMVKALATRPAVMYLEKLAPPEGPGAPDVKGALLINCGPQKAAIVKVVAQLEALAASGPTAEKPTDVTIQQVKLRQIKPRDGPELTWGFKGDYVLVAVGAGSAEELLGRLGKSGGAPKWLTSAEGLAAKSRISSIGYLDVAAITKLVREQAPPQADAVISALGLANVKAVSSASGLDEQGMFSRTFVSVDGQPQGLLELVAEKPLTAADLKGIPHDATNALAARCDLAAIYQEAIKRIGEVEPSAAAQATSTVDALEQQLGFHIERDLLASLGDVWTVHTAPADGTGGWTGLVVTASVRDKNKLTQHHGKLLELVKQMAGPQAPFTIRESKIGNTTVYQLVPKGPLPVSPSWCVTDTHLVVAATLQTLKAQLSRGAKSRSIADLPAIANRLKSGASLVTYEETKSTLRGLYTSVQTFGPLLTNMAAQQEIEFSLPALPSLEVIEPHVLAGIGTMRRTKSGIYHESQRTVPLGGGSQLVTAPVMIALLLPAVQSAREAARRNVGSNNLKQLALAMHNHYADHKKLPAPAIVGKEDKPLLSWRVAVLPYLGEEALHKEFRLDEPWDSEHNRKLIEKMPAVFNNPSSTVGDEGKTVYLLPTGKGTMFEGNNALTFQEVTDGLSNTIMIVEAADDAAVEWTKPGDLSFDPAKPTAGLSGARPGGFQAAFGDGSVRFLADAIDESVLKALFTPRGGETVDAP